MLKQDFMEVSEKIYSNPNYDRLSEHVILENEICQKRQESYNQAFTLICDFVFEESLVKIQLNELSKKLDDENFYTLNNFAEISIISYLLNRKSSPIDSKITTKINQLLEDLKKSKHYPINKKSLIVYFLRNLSKVNMNFITEIQTQLKIEAQKQFNNNNLEVAFDISLGCQDLNNVVNINNIYPLLQSNIKNWSRGKIAKCLIQLNRLDNINLVPLINIFEEKIHTEVLKWLEPDIWLAVIESEKLINSNIEQHEIKRVFNSLKENNSKWTQVIDSIEENGVFLNLKSVIKTPDFSPIDDTFSLLALKSLNRDKYVELEKEKFETFKKFEEASKTGTLIDLNSIKIFIFFVIFCSISIGILGVSSQDFIKNLSVSYEIGIPPKSLKELKNILINPITLTILLIWWIYNLWIVLRDEKKLKIIDLLYYFPIFKNLKKKYFSK